MTCEVCGKNATFFFKQTKNGYTVEKALCSECASKQGLADPSDLFDAIHDDFFGGLLGSFVNKEQKLVSSRSCSVCGMTIGELLNGGKVGCANCYTVFERSLAPTVIKLHGNVAHCGKMPKSLEAAAQAERTEKAKTADPKESKPLTHTEKLAALKNKLNDAVEKQEYELAAEYRDEIKALEEKISLQQNEENGGEEK